MLTLPPSVKIYVATQPTDARKSFDGLAALADRVVQRVALLVAHVVGIDGLRVHDLALGQVGGLVEHETAVVNAGLERLHRFQL
ncbi:MAG: hypothetical protein ABSC94_12910 [Polyangiaceae bacterium]